METVTKTQVNIELVQKAFADFGNGNIPGIIDVCADDITWASWGNEAVPYATTYHGKEGVMQFFTNLAGSIDYTAFEPKEFYATGNKVFAKVYHAAVVKTTGKSFAHDSLLEFTIVDEKVQRFFAYVDTNDQVKAFTK